MLERSNTITILMETDGDFERDCTEKLTTIDDVPNDEIVAYEVGKYFKLGKGSRSFRSQFLPPHTFKVMGGGIDWSTTYTINVPLSSVPFVEALRNEIRFNHDSS